MSKFNTAKTQRATVTPAAKSYIITNPVPTGRTGEGAPGYARDAKSELFLLAVTNFVSESTFYETGAQRDDRFKALVRQVAVEDRDWTLRFLQWLRHEGNMRSASIVGAIEAAVALLATKNVGGRQIIASAIARADEPGEALAYWLSTYGRKIPKPIKRGIADAAREQYVEFTWLKYDSAKDAVRFADVIEMCHVDPKDAVQSALFRYAIESRHGRAQEVPTQLGMVEANRHLRLMAQTVPAVLTDPETLKQAGFNWEDALSLLGQVPKELDPASLKAKVWAAMIPNMGYMALLRNLNNISEHGDAAMIQAVAEKLTDPRSVARSRQFPFRFLSAHKATQTYYHHHWAGPLATALQHSLSSVPELPGRTLVLVDISGSMANKLSGKSEMTRVEAGGLFGAALAVRNAGRVTLVEFDDRSSEINVKPNQSVLDLATRFHARGGTAIARAVQAHYRQHDRVIILTDEQARDTGITQHIPESVPLYVWNLAGYKYGSVPTGPRRHIFGGLTDASFRLIPLLEAGESQSWPF